MIFLPEKILEDLILELVKSFGPEFRMKRGTGQTSTCIPSSFAIRPQRFCLVFGKIHIAKYESTFIELRINDNDNLEKNCCELIFVILIQFAKGSSGRSLSHEDNSFHVQTSCSFLHSFDKLIN